MAKSKDRTAQEDATTCGTAVPPTDMHRHRRRHGRRRRRPSCPLSGNTFSSSAVLSTTFVVFSLALSLGSYAGASSSFMSNDAPAGALLPLSKLNDNYHLRGRRIQEWEEDDDDDDVIEDVEEDGDDVEDSTLVVDKEGDDEDDDDDEDVTLVEEDHDDDDKDDGGGDDDVDAAVVVAEAPPMVATPEEKEDDDNVDAPAALADESPMAAITKEEEEGTTPASATDPVVAKTVILNGEEFTVVTKEEEGLIPGTGAAVQTEPTPCLTEDDCRDRATQLNTAFSVQDSPSSVGCYTFNGNVHWVEGGTEEEMTADPPGEKKERLWCDIANDIVPQIAASAATLAAASSVGHGVGGLVAGSTTSGDVVEGESENPLVPAKDSAELKDLENELNDVNAGLAELESLETQAYIDGNGTTSIYEEIEDLAERDKELMGEIEEKVHELDAGEDAIDMVDEAIDTVDEAIDVIDENLSELQSLEMQDIIEGLEDLKVYLNKEEISDLESLKMAYGINSTTSIDEEIKDLEDIEDELLDKVVENNGEPEGDEIDHDFDGAFGDSVEAIEDEIDYIKEEIEDIEEEHDDGSFSEEKEDHIENLEKLEEQAEEELKEEEAILDNEAPGKNITTSTESLAGDQIDPILTMDLTTMNPPPIWGNGNDDEDYSVLSNNVTNAKEVTAGGAGSTMKESESPPFKMDTEPERVKPSHVEVDMGYVGDVAAVTEESDDDNDDDVITEENVVPCLTQEACQKKATELSTDFSIRESSTKGCYMKNDVVYWVEDGTDEEMTSIPESSKKTRVWCIGDDQEVVVTAALKVKAPSVEPEKAADEAKILTAPSVGNTTEPAEEAERESEDKEDNSSADVAAAETSSPTQQPDEAEVSTTLPPTHALSPKATEAPFPTSEPTASSNNSGTTITSQPSSRPSLEYIEPNDDTLDPLANESSTQKEAFEDGEAIPEGEGAFPETSSNSSIAEDVEEEVKKVGGWLTFASIILMIYTAYQMSENPDGICASLCRLVITVIGCIIKIMLIPFKYIMGGRQSGGHYMATPDYRDPYGSRHMELT